MDDPLIRLADIRAAGHCVKGARRWFSVNKLDFRAFMRDGLPASKLLMTGDALAEQVVKARIERDRG